jgi:hypothetical protein
MDDYGDHLLEKHLTDYTFIYLDNEQKVKDWLADKKKPYNSDQAFNLLRVKFHKNNSDSHLMKNVIKNPDMGKVLMCRTSDMMLLGVAAY